MSGGVETLPQSCKSFAGKSSKAMVAQCDLQVWRDGYRGYLMWNGVPPNDAADIAAKVAYRADLYPTRMGSCVSPPPSPQLEREGPKRKGSNRARADVGSSTRSELKLLEAGATIAANPPGGDDMAFTHSVLCQVGLPRKEVKGREFMRKSGAAWLNVQAGVLDEGSGPVPQPVPYGAMPRIALAWVSTYAVRYKEREIPIGKSAADFLGLMGMGTDGHRYATLRKQIHALAAASLQLGFMGRTFNGQPVQQFDAWAADKETQRRALWPGVMVLSEGYYSSLIESSVPLDYRALKALKGSALALDMYVWLTSRLHRITNSSGVPLSWRALRVGADSKLSHRAD